jgi:hypothetical protein
MVGAYLRGRFSVDADAKGGIAERYGLESEPPGLGLRFEPERACNGHISIGGQGSQGWVASTPASSSR